MADIEIIHAGFASPANDYLEEEIDLNKLLKPRPTATFYGRVKGDCFIDAHIPNNSILVIDKSITPKNNSIIVAIIEGGLYLKRLLVQGKTVMLLSANKKYQPVLISEDAPLNVWGTVLKVIIDPVECAL